MLRIEDIPQQVADDIQGLRLDLFVRLWYNEINNERGKLMSQIKIGDFVTGYGSGYWQLIDIKPHIATEDYNSEDIHWEKGQVIGQLAVLKKCFTAKMKPRIDFSCEDSRWLKPVSDDVLVEIEKYFEEHSDYKRKFDTAEIKLPLTITNCWIDLPEEKEDEFRTALKKLPAQYTMDDFWKVAKHYKKYISKPPARYLLNLSMTHPWDIDKNANMVYSEWELIKN